MKLIQQQRQSVILIIVILVLCGLVMWSWQDASEPEQHAESVSESTTLPESLRIQASADSLAGPVLSLALPPQSDYAELIERPLFNPSRRPHQSSATVLEKTPPLDAYVLIGVINDTKGRRALLRDSQAQIWMVTSGDDLQGWKVESVLADRVTLSASDNEQVISFAPLESSYP